MNKLLLAFSLLVLVSFSSCKKGCIRCYAYEHLKDANGQPTDNPGLQVYESREVCGSSFDVNHYKKRFDKNFEAYFPNCVEVN